MTNPRSADAVDLHVGERIRARRQELNLSQSRLGEVVGVTFQQVQKYERGGNRVGAGRLFRIASFLEVPVEYFYDGLDGTQTLSASATTGSGSAAKINVSVVAEDKQMVRLIQAFDSLSGEHKANFLTQIESVADG